MRVEWNLRQQNGEFIYYSAMEPVVTHGSCRNSNIENFSKKSDVSFQGFQREGSWGWETSGILLNNFLTSIHPYVLSESSKPAFLIYIHPPNSATFESPLVSALWYLVMFLKFKWVRSASNQWLWLQRRGQTALKVEPQVPRPSASGHVYLILCNLH